MAEIFTFMLGDSWATYKRILKDTSGVVISAFQGSDLAEDVETYYPEALPKQGEGLIDFLKRNDFLSYKPTSMQAEIDREVLWSMAKLGEFTGRIPGIQKLYRLHGISAELYIGQDVQSFYIPEQPMKDIGGGQVSYDRKGASLNQHLDLDFDVGKLEKEYFLRLNVHRDERLMVAETMYSSMLEFLSQHKYKPIELVPGRTLSIF